MQKFKVTFSGSMGFDIAYLFPADFDYQAAIDNNDLVVPGISSSTKIFGKDKKNLLETEFEVTDIEYDEVEINDEMYGYDEDSDENSVHAVGTMYLEGTIEFLANSREDAEKLSSFDTDNFMDFPFDVFCNDRYPHEWLYDISSDIIEFSVEEFTEI